MTNGTNTATLTGGGMGEHALLITKGRIVPSRLRTSLRRGVLQSTPSDSRPPHSVPFGFAQDTPLPREEREPIGKMQATCLQLGEWGNRVRSFFLHENPLASAFAISCHVLLQDLTPFS